MTMRFPETSIENARGLGYTEDEARFLYLVAMHSGYFSTRQFLEFTGAKSGDRSVGFTQKVLGKGHAIARLLLRNGRVYHLFSRIVYRAIGRENLRNRREHGLEYIRSRLMTLDFVLRHLDYNYLETEHEKILYFCEQLSVPRQFLPTKRYTGAIHKKATERYFVDKFPMFFRPSSSSVVNFTFIDPGWETLKTFENHLFAYSGLFRALHDVHLTYGATRPTRFEAARKMFLSMVDRPPKVDPGEEVLRYFRLREAWEAKKYALFSNDDIERLNELTQRFGKHPCQERYPAWRDGQVSSDMVRSQFRDLAPPRKVTFDAEFVDGQAALFEANPKRKTNPETAMMNVKAVSDSTFSSPFRPVFAGEQEEATEK
ncbi:MAG TPA: hypothetical protein VGR97_03840 [Candidatus Acidoferrales bacterium]|nr:hypothetical protein [Candidatus Acidoferrales bacterium]